MDHFLAWSQPNLGFDWKNKGVWAKNIDLDPVDAAVGPGSNVKVVLDT